MEPLTATADGAPAPGPHESWEEWAEHSLTHDDVPGTRPAPARAA